MAPLSVETIGSKGLVWRHVWFELGSMAVEDQCRDGALFIRDSVRENVVVSTGMA